ncbi:hypothetical protein ACFQVC_06450 [Streptomyces monticola]|uniref:Uncharacterized protein n=1 Tax=Streptomyces monticola TaxID=2666263 RepID=A0ABW2JDU6_9ACTN
MFIFRCRRCHGEVTRPVREVPLPDIDEAPAPYEMRGDKECPPRMTPGTFAYEPPAESLAHVRPPSEWEPVTISPRHGLTGIVLAEADVRDVETTAKRSRTNGCCGLDGMDGPNLECRWCRAFVATKQSDCWTPQQVALVPAAVEIMLPPAPDTAEGA